jgi:hypothetical protein
MRRMGGIENGKEGVDGMDEDLSEGLTLDVDESKVESATEEETWEGIETDSGDHDESNEDDDD